MHHDSPYNTKKRTGDVDFFERATRIQGPPVAQVNLPVPVALAGHDPERVDVWRCGWRGQGYAR